MELKVVEHDGKKLVLEIPGETVTMTNVLREELWEDKNVKESAHMKEHPYLANPKVLVETSRGYPQTALKKAANRIIKQTEDFAEAFKKAVNK